MSLRRPQPPDLGHLDLEDLVNLACSPGCLPRGCRVELHAAPGTDPVVFYTTPDGSLVDLSPFHGGDAARQFRAAVLALSAAKRRATG